MKTASLFCLSATLFLQGALSQTPPANPAPAAPAPASQDKPRVYITDSNSWEIRGAAGGNSNGFAASSSGGARPQTAEVIKTFGQRCPEIIVNNHVSASDYVVELDHEGGKGLLRHKDKIAVFVQTSGDSIFSESTLSVGGSVKDACLWSQAIGPATNRRSNRQPSPRKSQSPSQQRAWSQPAP